MEAQQKPIEMQGYLSIVKTRPDAVSYEEDEYIRQWFVLGNNALKFYSNEEVCTRASLVSPTSDERVRLLSFYHTGRPQMHASLLI